MKERMPVRATIEVLFGKKWKDAPLHPDHGSHERIHDDQQRKQ
jgi:hypothetical protein